jgi:ribosomal protein S18 acetylase RimI-like enzyme
VVHDQAFVLATRFDLEHEKRKWIALAVVEIESGNAGIIGSCTLNDTHKRTPWISVFAINSDRRRKGWGTRLLQEAIAAARKEGATGINLWVHKDNQAAIRLYKKQGFIFCSDPDESTGIQMMYRSLEVCA